MWRNDVQGLALIELAVVMVVICLIMGGVVKGRKLLTNSKVTNVVNQLKAVPTATGLYKNRFPAVAFPQLSSLQNAGVLTGKGSLKNRFGGDVYLMPGSGGFTGSVVSTKIPGAIARLVDDQIDDGVPGSGLLKVYTDTPVLNARPTGLAAPATILTTMEATIVLDFK